MPLLSFYLNPGMLSAPEKAELAQFLTAGYAKVMPAFYVNIVFHEFAPESFFLAGAPTERNHVRLVLEHIAVNFKDNLARANNFLDDFVGTGLTERFGPRGWTWEFNVVESRRELWRLNSLEPPPQESEALKMWMKEGKAVPWKHLEFNRTAKN